ncbi:MAG: hypothetical protein LBL67_01420 [Coriobacteriales bacterium]|jgi:formate C-acetyltransferase|nr:hypothetical protein [Coriobacteriales bacterium]
MYKKSPISERIASIRERYRNTVPTIMTERFKIVTEFYKAHPDLPAMKKRALVFKELCEKMPTPIHKHELVVGDLTSIYRGSALYPDCSAWMFENFRVTDPRERELDRYEVSDEDLEYIWSEEDFWLKNNLSHKMDNSLTPGFHKIVGNGVTTFGDKGCSTMPTGHYCVDFELVINKGFKAIGDEARAHLAAIDGKLYGEDAKKAQFYEAISIVSDAMLTYAERYAQEADRQAAACEYPERKAELEMMAKTLRWIFKNPCRTLYEAVEAMYLYQTASGLSEALHGTSWGRADQYLGGFYQEDLEAGRITPEYGQEIIDAFCLKLAESNRVSGSEVTYANGGYTSGQLITLGGVGRDGKDATNALTYMFLQSADRLDLHDPPMSVRIDDDTPEELWEAAIETTKRHGGLPTFESDNAIIPALAKRMSLEDARDYCLIGCVEPAGAGDEWPACGGSGQESFWLLSGLANQAINNGENPKKGPDGKTTGQTGIATGYLYEMKDFDEVLAAVEKQMDYFVDWHIAFTNIHEYVVAENAPLPVISAVMDGCMESGKDVSWGGAKYNSTGFAGVGLGTLVDSLAVIKYMVFDKKLIDAKDFLEAVNSNWEGQEELRQTIHKIVPRYGNDDPYVDEIAKWVADKFSAKVSAATGPRGNHFAPGLYPVALHVLYGMISPATPDGRKAGEPLSDGISPVQQMDKSGPLSTLKSTSVFDHSEFPNGTLLNMKLHPKSVEGEGLHKLEALIKSYMDLGGMELQFNIVSPETLRDAQANPEAHKDLVVRIAGFSAYFTELFKGMQDDVIYRTEVEL